MKRPVPSFCAAALLLPLCAGTAPAATASAAYTPAPFSDYQPILDRMPFGAPPPDGGQALDPEQAKTDAQVKADQQKLAKQVNMSCVNITPDGGIAVGFTDLSEKPPANYYLRVGTASRGWTVLAADYDEEWAQIEHDGITITLKLGEGLIDAPPVHAAPAPAAAATPPPAAEPAELKEGARQLPPGLIRRSSQRERPDIPGLTIVNRAENQQREDLAKLKASGGDIGSYMERLRERKAKETAEKAAAEEAARKQIQELAQKITQDELKKREREMNLNLIEQGAHPISEIELTPEEEAALAERGVLLQ